jgi:transcriptional regulator of heat shock response
MSAIMYNEDITEEERNKIIEYVAEKIIEYNIETISILTLESIKPLVYIGGEMSRMLIAPFLSIFGWELNKIGEKYITIFEKRDNINRLIKLIENKSKE